MAKRGGARGSGGTLAVALLFLLVGAAGGIGVAYLSGTMPFIAGDERTVTVEEVRQLNELATVQTTASVPVPQESGVIEPLPEFIRGESVLLIAAGDVRAGIDLDELEQGDVRVADESVTIDLPEPEILSSSLDEERTSVYDREQGLLDFSPDEDLETQARREAIDDIEAAARENGILDQAQQNAETSLRAFIQSLGFETVEFE